MRAMMAPAPGCSTLPVDRRALTQCRVVSRGLRRNMPQKGDIPDLSKNHNLRREAHMRLLRLKLWGVGSQLPNSQYSAGGPPACLPRHVPLITGKDGRVG